RTAASRCPCRSPKARKRSTSARRSSAARPIEGRGGRSNLGDDMSLWFNKRAMPLKVPLLDLQAQYTPLRAEILAAIERVCDSQRFIMGPEITSLEGEMARMLGVRHAIAVSSGTDALLLALMALDIKPGDEVVTPTYSFFATAGAVARLGARPVLVDIDEATFNIDTAQAVAAITPRTKAIVPVHLFGQSADMDPLLEASSRARIPIVEDAAQAIGATYKSRPLGSLGAFG